MDAVGIRLRESPRIEIVGRARLQLGSAAGPVDAALLDLSATGMGLATSAAAPKPLAGEECAFDLAFDGVRVEGRGVVVWSRRARPDRGDAANVGVYFHRIEGAGKSELTAILEQGLTAGRRPSIAERAIFAPVVERAAEPLAVSTEVARPASVATTRADAMPKSDPRAAPEPGPSLEPEPRPDRGPSPDSSGIPDPVAPAASAAMPAALPAREPEPEIVGRIAPPVPGLERREDLASAGSNAVADASSPARRRWWIGLAGAVVAVAALLMLRPLLDQEREPAPAGAGPALISAAASDRPAAAAVESRVEEPAPAEPEPAAAPPVSGGPPTSPRAASSSPAVAPLPDTLAAPDRSAPAPAAAPEPAVRAAALDAAPAASVARARRVLAIEPGASDGAEVVVLRADGPWRRQDVFAALIGPDPPRYLLKLSGIEHRWSPADVEVGSSLVQRVRTGLHATSRGPELHIVLDLSTRAVDHSFEVEGEVLRIRLRPREP